MHRVHAAVVHGAVLFVCSFGAASAQDQAAGRSGLEHVVPAETLAFASIDVDRMLVEGRGLDLARLWNDEEIQDFLAPALGPMRAAFPMRLAQGFATLSHGYGFPDIIGGRVSFAMLGSGLVGEQGPPRWLDATERSKTPIQIEPGTLWFPDFVVTVETSGRAAFEASFARVLELEPGIVSTPAQIDGLDVIESVVPIPVDASGTAFRKMSLFHGFAGDLFIASTRAERVAQIANAARAPKQDALVSQATFKNHRAEIVRDGSVAELFVNVPAMLAHGLPIASAFDASLGEVAPMLQQTGARGFGASIAFEGGRVRQSIGLLVGSSSMVGGMARMFARPGILQRSAPIEGSMLALSLGVDWEAIVNAAAMDASSGVDDALTQASNLLGVDVRSEVLPALGDTLTIRASLPEHAIVPIPDWTLDVTLRDAAGMAEILGALRAKLPELSGGAATANPVTLEGHPEAFSIRIADVPFSPLVVVEANRLVIANSMATMKSTLAQLKTPPPAGDFAKSGESTFGAGGADVCFALYLDLARIAARGVPYLQTFAPAIEQAGIPLRFDELPLDVLVEHLSGAMTTVRLSEQAIVLDESSPFGSQLVALGAVGVATQDPTASLLALDVPAPADEVGTAPQQGAAFMGVQTEFGLESSDGVPVIGITAGSPAEAAGLRVGDRLLTIGVDKMRSQSDVLRVLGLRRPGDVVVVAYSRDGAVREVTVTLARRGEFVNADGTKRTPR
ncbi:MAG: PDZ domain-containing protein [Planctomycetes bacterium]|nr:PDZ domain-containing protein [Planctomycetota bacterium]MCC7172550.1 PDZ domain-containing protein [Planctomycetota bacterium]